MFLFWVLLDSEGNNHFRCFDKIHLFNFFKIRLICQTDKGRENIILQMRMIICEIGSNVLTGIQSLVVSQKTEEARQQISNFAQLMRNILSNSRKPMIKFERRNWNAGRLSTNWKTQPKSGFWLSFSPLWKHQYRGYSTAAHAFTAFCWKRPHSRHFTHRTQGENRYFIRFERWNLALSHHRQWHWARKIGRIEGTFT